MWSLPLSTLQCHLFQKEGREGGRGSSACALVTRRSHTLLKYLWKISAWPNGFPPMPSTQVNQGSAFDWHAPGQSLIFSDYLGDSHWAFPLECELQKPKGGVFFTLEFPAVSTRSVIVGWTSWYMYTLKKNRYLNGHRYVGKASMQIQNQAFSPAHPRCKSLSRYRLHCHFLPCWG